MKHINFFLCLMLTTMSMVTLLPQTYGQVPNADWVASLGNEGGGADVGNAVAVDAAGNVYTTGGFTGKVIFGSYTLVSAGSGDIFVLKQDAAGSVLWAFRAGGGANSEQGLGIDVDASGNVYVTGSINGAVVVDMDPSANTGNITGAGGNDIFVAKYNGNLLPANTSFFQWAFRAGGTSDDSPTELVLDASGYFYLTGSFVGSFDMDPSASTKNISSAGLAPDVFAAKYNGNLLPSSTSFCVWAFRVGGTSNDYRSGITAGADGMVYLTGIIGGTGAIDMDPSTNTRTITGAGGSDVFVAKYDGNLLPASTSFYQWAFRAGGTLTDEARDIAVDAGGNVYITGYIYTLIPIDMDPSAGVNTLMGTTAMVNMFAAKYDGTRLPTDPAFFKWAFIADGGASSNSGGKTIAVDASGYVYLGGYISGSADMDPSVNVTTETNPSQDFTIVLARYDGNLLPSSTSFYQWSFICGSSCRNMVNDFALDGTGGLHMTGELYCGGAVDMDPSSNVNNVLVAGGNDVIIAKYDVTLSPSSTSFYKWASDFGSAGNLFRVMDVVTDAAGNSYSTGYISGPVDLDPGPGVYLISGGSNNPAGFVAKHDPAGNVVWAFELGNGSLSADSKGTTLAVDAAGNVYLGGEVKYGCDLDPSANTDFIQAPDMPGIFVAKYSGNLLPDDPAFYQWGFVLTNNATSVASLPDIKLENSGMIYICGNFNGGTQDYDPSPGVYNLPGYPFIAKYNGNLPPSDPAFFQMAFTISSFGGNGYFTDVETDGLGNIYVAVKGAAFLDIDPSVNSNNAPGTGSHMIIKYDGNLPPTSTSFYKWYFRVGGTGNDIFSDMEVDASGTILVVGAVTGTTALDMDPSANTRTVTGAGGMDIIMAKYDGSLLPSNTAFYKWAFRAGATGDDHAVKFDRDASGMAYLTGYINGSATIDMDPSANTNTIAGAGNRDIFVAKYDVNLTPTNTAFYQYAFRVGRTGVDEGLGIGVSAGGHAYVGGSFTGINIDFDPTVSVLNQSTTAGIFNGFIAKYHGEDPLLYSRLMLSANLSGNQVRLDWQYEGDEQPLSYVVQRNDGNGFAEIETTGNHLFLDIDRPSGTSFYRIAGLDIDGHALYSNIVEVTLSGDAFVSIYPNPAHDVVNVICPGTFNYSITNAAGKVMLKGVGSGVLTIDTQLFPSGVYIIQVNHSWHKIIVE